MTAESAGSERQAYAEVVVARFRPTPSALSEVRRVLRKALGDLLPGPVDDDVTDSLLLAGNELATNAVLHARTDFEVCVLANPRWIRIEVADGNSRMPQPCLTPSDATSGRGLAMIDGSGLLWGAERRPGGKIVWAEGRRPVGAPTPDRPVAVPADRHA